MNIIFVPANWMNMNDFNTNRDMYFKRLINA